MERRKAYEIAQTLKAVFRPSSERIEIAGSLRRRQDFVKDIEFVIVPAVRPFRKPGSLFVEDGKPLLAELDRLAASSDTRFAKGRAWGERYRQVVYRSHGGEGLAVDLFFVDADSFGYQLAIRTGPAEFSQRLVSPGPWGCLPAGCSCLRGQVLKQGRPVAVREEAEFFDFLGLPHWDPPVRSVLCLEKHRERCGKVGV